MTAELLAHLKQRMEEEHRLDREALQRLMSRYGDNERRKSSLGKNTPNQDEGFYTKAYRAEIVNHLSLHPERDFTPRELADELTLSGINIRAKRTDVAIQRTLVALVDQGIVIETAPRSGRNAGKFKWKGEVAHSAAA